VSTRAAVWDAPTRTATQGVGTVTPAVPSPSVAPPAPAEGPAEGPADRSSTSGCAALAGAAVLWGRLVLFTSLPGWWAAAVAAVAGVALAVLCVPPAQPGLQSAVSALTAMCTTGAVSSYLVGWSWVPWWGVLAVAVLLSPVLVEVGELVGMVTARVTGGGGLPADAGSAAGLVNAAVLVIMLLHGRQPAVVVLAAGAGMWLVTSLVSAVPL
jgi:hypothetical protein